MISPGMAKITTWMNWAAMQTIGPFTPDARNELIRRSRLESVFKTPVFQSTALPAATSVSSKRASTNFFQCAVREVNTAEASICARFSFEAILFPPSGLGPEVLFIATWGEVLRPEMSFRSYSWCVVACR